MLPGAHKGIEDHDEISIICFSDYFYTVDRHRMCSGGSAARHRDPIKCA
jgi:hypothetical protein